MADATLNNSFQILVNGVVFKNGHVLVSRRSLEEEHMPGWWTIPGGKVDVSREDVFSILQKTLKREVAEETGVEIADEMDLVVNNSYVKENGQPVVAVVFKCQYKSGQAQPLEDTIDCKWVTLTTAHKMDFPPNVKEYIMLASKM